MKTIVLLSAILSAGCSTLDNALNNNLNACWELQKSISRDRTMRDIAMLEMAKTANEQTKMATLSAINSPRQSVACK